MSWPDAYWDYETFPWDWRPSEPRCALEVELQRQAWGFLGADKDGNVSVLKSVARVQFLGSGQFGRPSSRLVVSTLVEAFVLVGIASSVTVRVAKLLYGDSFRECTETSFQIMSHERESSDKSNGSRFFVNRSSKSAMSFQPVGSRKGTGALTTSEAQSCLAALAQRCQRGPKAYPPSAREPTDCCM
eukprot:3515355-Amphidinium_carterae.1